MGACARMPVSVFARVWRFVLCCPAGVIEHVCPSRAGVADGTKQVTAWPSALTCVMSWDRDAMYAFGQAMGLEQVRALCLPANLLLCA